MLHPRMYPRRYRLGLIEAHEARLSLFAKILMYPRRYRLGLIEAPELRAPGPGPGRVSEALSPRPH